MRGSPFGFTNFSRGVNVLDSPYTLNDGEARDCLNIVSSPRGAIRKRYGSQVFASGATANFPTLATTDTFIRANESPLSNSGKWTAIGGKGKGRIKENVWEETKGDGSELEEGGFWNVAEQNNPAVSLTLSQVLPVHVGAHIGVLACVDATGKKWYEARARFVSGSNYEVLLIKENAGVSTTLATVASTTWANGDRIGISVRGGQVAAWRYASAIATWEQLVAVADGSYTKGFSGFLGAIAGGFNNFSSGEITVPSTEAPFTSLLACAIGGVNYLVGVSGKKIFSVTEAGEMTDITDGLAVTEGLPWSIIQSTSGAPNRVTADGPIYLVNGVDPPRYWTGATKGTPVAEWTSKPEGAFAAVPKAKYLVYLGNRVWAAGNTAAGYGSSLKFSGFSIKAGEGEQADPTNWPSENIVQFEQEDGESITGIGIAGSYLMVFKKHKTWAVYDLNEGENRRLSDSVGCISHRSIVETPQGTFFLTPDQGVYVTNGTSVREVSRNVRPLLQGTDPFPARSAKLDQLENAAAGYLNGHYYLSYMAQDGTMKTLDYDTQLQSWWIHDLAGNQWVRWEPKPGTSSLYTIPRKVKGGIVRAFVPGVYQDSGVNYVGGNGLTCYWLSSWEPFFQYVLRHRINQPQTKKRVRELFVDGKGQLVTLVARKFGSSLEVLKGTVDNVDMAAPASPLTLGAGEFETQAARYYSLGASRVWSFGFGNASAEPLEIDTYAVDLSFRKS